MAHDAAADYQIAIAEAMNRPEGVLCLRVPQQHRYLEALDAAVANALDGSSSPQAALWQAAATWESITNEIGRESQLKAYQRSLGVD
jgi:multiple sugar transport system substrate-binding protein